MALFQTPLNPSSTQLFLGRMKDKLIGSVGKVAKPLQTAFKVTQAVQNPVGSAVGALANKVVQSTKNTTPTQPAVLPSPQQARITGVPITDKSFLGAPGTKQATPPPTAAQLAAVRAAKTPTIAQVAPKAAPSVFVPPATQTSTMGQINAPAPFSTPTVVAPKPTVLAQPEAAAPQLPTLPTAAADQSVTQPAGPSELEQQRDAIRQAYMDSLRLSPDEQRSQDELARLTGEANAAIFNVDAEGSQRGFTTGYATGLKGAFGRKADIAKLKLEARIANIQAAREAQQKASQAQLGFVQSDVEAERAAQKEQSTLSREDAASKRSILLSALQGGATQEQMAQILAAKTPDEAIQVAGSLLQQKTAPKHEIVGAGQSIIDSATGQVVYQAPEKPSGYAAMSPLDQLKYDAEQLKMSGESPEQIQAQRTKVLQSQQVIQSIDSLLTDPGLNSAVGPISSLADPSGKSQTFISKLDSFKAQMTIPELGTLKGAMSDKDIMFLQNAVGALNRKMEQKDFRKSLNEIKARNQHIVNKLQLAPDLQEMYDQVRMSDPALSSEDIMAGLEEQIGAFNGAPTTALNGSAKQIATAIKQVESGGNYNARGGSGEGGAYQFMPASWKQWAGQYLGNPNAPQTPQNQDRVAEAKIQSLLNQGYNAKQVALIWNGGQPIAKKGVNKFGVAYDSGGYANKVVSALNRTA